MDKDNKFFCIEPYVGLSIIEPGKAFCCCLHEGTTITTPEDVWNDPYLKNIRVKFDNNEIPDECKPCVEQENLNRQSRRLDSNTTWLKNHNNFKDFKETDAPYKLDFWTGNICNLACATCAADDSSLWGTLQKRKDIKQFHRNRSPKNYAYKKENPPNINFKNIEWIHFNGGEPLLTNTHFDVIKKIPKEQRRNVRLEYNTNGTVRVDLNNEKYQIFKEFKSVDLCFSLDGIEETFEYTRWPAKWKPVKDNIDYWAHQVLTAKHTEPCYLMISFNIVKSVYNYDKIDETVNYINNRWVDPVKQQHKIIEGDMIYLCNDHRHLDFTDKDFENYKKTQLHVSEMQQINNLRKR